MTATDIALPSDRAALARADQIGQITAVEQARAVAQVQAMVIVAQQVPRDMGRAWDEMRRACGAYGLANRAFYAVKNRGSGPSVHLARELARIWGNVEYGVHELRRDDAAGESEIQAFAWDIQTNTRSTRTFVVPHARMAGGSRKKLTDLTDIYLSNQNVGARAVRECIFTVLPTDFVDEAQDLCRAALRGGDGVDLADRVTKMVAAFAKYDVTVDDLEQRIGRKRGEWTAEDVAQMVVVFKTIDRDHAPVEEFFDRRRVTADEITASSAVEKPVPAAAAADDEDAAWVAAAEGAEQ